MDNGLLMCTSYTFRGLWKSTIRGLKRPTSGIVCGERDGDNNRKRDANIGDGFEITHCESHLSPFNQAGTLDLAHTPSDWMKGSSQWSVPVKQTTINISALSWNTTNVPISSYHNRPPRYKREHRKSEKAQLTLPAKNIGYSSTFIHGRKDPRHRRIALVCGNEMVRDKKALSSGEAHTFTYVEPYCENTLLCSSMR